MSIDMKIRSIPKSYYWTKDGISIPLAHVNMHDLKRGNKIVNMGARLEECNYVLATLMMMCEEDCEGRLVHEILHIILYEQEGAKTTVLFDRVDYPPKISRCGLKKTDVEGWLMKYKFPVETTDELVEYLQEQIKEQHKGVKKLALRRFLLKMGIL